MLLSDFDFVLPRDAVADHPVSPRDAARLLHVSPPSFFDSTVRDLGSLLCPGDVLVLNNTKVIPAFLVGYRDSVRIQITLHKEVGVRTGCWEVFAKPAKRLKVGDRLVFADDFEATVEDKLDSGLVVLRFNRVGDGFFSGLLEYGNMPLPPYINRDTPLVEDAENYQTIYAKHQGAVAAPTAGLHFTDDLLEELRSLGVKICYVTLHVGAGTFLPVKVESVSDHVMHSEYCVLTQETVDCITACQQQGGRVVAVGTTSLRVLESAVDTEGALHPFCGETDIFITPGYKFQVVDLLMTNFHLPKSTLFMLVSAFCGLSMMQRAYQHAIAAGYRFYSYGDACLLEREKNL